MLPTLLETYGLLPEEIERRSFALIESMIPRLPEPEGQRQVRLRLVHTSGDPALGPVVAFHPAAVDAAMAAIKSGALIMTDARMVQAGINAGYSPVKTEVLTVLDAPGIAERARREGTTRVVAGVRELAARLDGAIFAVGNAPTALLAALDLVDAGLCRPACIVGMPVGFINAAESKDELMRRDLPWITIPGWRGGSPLAAATVNALLRLAAGKGNYQALDR